ncbi:biopolymer transporter ExbD [Lysobacteraceae bacterium NML120232]|nr:biopolymer transporter ExbD [Xanthomonadaceae bacterium NML120232]
MSAGRNRRMREAFEENHEINVTPFIDVMLVLLMIFMVAAPLATVDIPVDLPEANRTAPPSEQEPLLLTVHSNLSISLNDEVLPPEGLASALRQLAKENPNQRIYIRADKTVPYGELIKVMDQLQSIGLHKVALVTLEASKK